MLASVAVHALALLLLPGATIDHESVWGSEGVSASLDPDPIRLVRLAVTPEAAVPEVSVPPVVPRSPVVAVREIAGSRPVPNLTRAVPRSGRRAVALRMRGDASRTSAAEEERYVRPVARVILPNWRAPRSMHGVAVTARVHLDATGDPTGFVELVPPTVNREFKRKIADRVRSLEYQPASRNGEPVAAWAEITFVFCHTGVTATSPAPPELPEAPCNPQRSKKIESR